MRRRSFIQMLAGLVAAPAVAKVPEPEWKPVDYGKLSLREINELAKTPAEISMPLEIQDRIKRYDITSDLVGPSGPISAEDIEEGFRIRRELAKQFS